MKMNPNSHTVIIGAGHAGGSIAHQLRQLGYPGSITLIGDEGCAPYQRPPLSKGWLKGTVDAQDLALRPDTYYTESQVTCHLEDRACSVDRLNKVVRLDSGRAIDYDHLVIATGAKARTLETPVRNGVVYLRTVQDAMLLKSRLQRKNTRIAILGAGFIGLEVAATASLLDAQVTVIERGPRVLNRVASQPISDFISKAHQAAGVRFLFDAQVESFEFEQEHISAVLLADGTTVTCDLLLIGIGAIPNDAIAREAGVTCDDGILVDEHSRTSDPAIYAIGDVSRTRLADGRMMPRLESVPNALEQAKKAAAAIAGAPMPKDEVPWFWSDQYALKLQMVGMRSAQSETIIRHAEDGASVSVFHVKDGRLEAAETINVAKDFLISKRAISTGQRVDTQTLGDVSRPTADAFSS
ncbi:NAD(P)/FAD-dependent oxidoreductase [Pseudomonas putida]